jgi:hypothetical protein
MSEAPPSSPAGASLRVELPPSPPPPRPGLRSVPGILLAGLPTLLFSALMAGALTMPFAGHFRPPPRVLEIVVFTVIPAVGLVIFVGNWWASLRAWAEHGPSWPFLFVPFFIVSGIAMGVGVIHAAVTGLGEPGSVVIRSTCGEVGGDDMTAREQCEVRGRACADALMAEGRDTVDALEACIRQRPR